MGHSTKRPRAASGLESDARQWHVSSNDVINCLTTLSGDATILVITREVSVSVSVQPRGEGPKVPVGLRMDESLKRDLERLAAADNRTLSALITMILTNWVASKDPAP